MKRCFELSSVVIPGVSLRTITESDLENLRIWKNQNRKSFFYQEVISPADQRKWFEGYLERLNDYLFVILSGDPVIGCLGFRYVDEHIDIYNVIRGVSSVNSKGFMSKALRIMCSYVLENYSGALEAKVLRDNLALNWYERNAFKPKHVYEIYADMELDLKVFVPCSVKVIEIK